MTAAPALRRLLAVFAALAMWGTSLPVLAQLRTFPANTQVGKLSVIGQGWVRIEKTDFPLAPGVQIRNQQNMIVLPMAVVGEYKDLPVRVQWDAQGQIWKLWLLTEGEAQALAK